MTGAFPAAPTTSTPGCSDSTVAHVESGEAPTALAINEHKVTVRVAGDMAVTTVQQRFFNGSERAAPVEYRLRVPDGAVVAQFRVEQNEAWVTAQPGTVASRSRGGGLPGLLASPSGEVYASLGALSPGTARAPRSPTSSGSHTTARSAHTSIP